MKVSAYWVGGEIQAATWIFTNGTQYTGEYEKNKPKGSGTWEFVNGNVTLGEYKNSQARVEGTSDIDTKLTWVTNEEMFDPRVHKISSD